MNKWQIAAILFYLFSLVATAIIFYNLGYLRAFRLD